MMTVIQYYNVNDGCCFTTVTTMSCTASLTFPPFLHVQDGKTALHHAVEHGYTNTVKVLSQKGQADVNVTDQVSL